MAKGAARRKKSKKGRKASARGSRAAKKPSGAGRGAVPVQLVNAGMHDLTNLATAVKAYLELLSSQSVLDDKQKYYVDRAREQVEMMVDLVRELKEKLN